MQVLGQTSSTWSAQPAFFRCWRSALCRADHKTMVCPAEYRRKALCIPLAGCLGGSGQPGQPAPAQPSYSLQDSNLRPALPGALAGVSIEQRLNQQVPLDVVSATRPGRVLPLSSFFADGKPVILAPGLLSLPHALHRDPDRPRERAEGGFARCREGFSRRQHQLRPERYPGAGRGQEADVRETVQPPEFGQRLALPHRRRGQYQGASPMPSASITNTTRRPSNTPTPAPS